MRKTTVFVFVIVFGFCSLQSKGQYSFERQYSVPSYITAMVELNDGYTIVGATDSAPGTQLILFKTDRKGSVIWAKKFWSDTAIYLFPVSMNLTDDSCYLISGGANEILCMKTDKNGNLLWSRKLGVDIASIGRSILTDDGGVVAIANRNDSTGYTFPIIFKLDQNGNLLWCTNLSDVESLLLNDLIHASNGDIICEGQYIDSYDHLATVVFRFTSDGSLLWGKSYSFDVTFLSWSIVPTLCGYFIVGNTDSTCCPHGNPLVMKIDEEGHFLWAREYANWFSGQALSAVQTGDGGAVFTTWVQTGIGTSAGLTKIDSSGTAQWTHLYGVNDYGSGFNMRQTGDNGFISAGALNAGGAPLRLYKSNNAGEISCNDTLIYPISYNKTCTVSDVGVTSTGIQIENLFLHVSDFDLTDSLICIDSFTSVPQTPAFCNVAVGIHNANDKSILIQPNPASDYFTLSYQLEKEISVTITDAFGREVKQFMLNPSLNSQVISVNDLPVGVYLVTLREEDKIETKKVVVQR